MNEFKVGGYSHLVYVENEYRNGHKVTGHDGDSPYAAIRLAIVRAAAEIAIAMADAEIAIVRAAAKIALAKAAGNV